MTDALIMDGALVGRRESDAAVEAMQAGADLLLYPKDPRRVRDALRAALASGALSTRAAGRVARPLRPRAGRRDALDASGHPGPVRVGRLRWPTRCWSRAWCAATPPRLDRAARSGRGGRRYRRTVPAGSERLRFAGAGTRAGRPLRRRLARGAGVRRAAGLEGTVGVRRPRRGRRWPTTRPDADLIVLFGHPRLVERAARAGPGAAGLAPPAADAGGGGALAAAARLELAGAVSSSLWRSGSREAARTPARPARTSAGSSRAKPSCSASTPETAPPPTGSAPAAPTAARTASPRSAARRPTSETPGTPPCPVRRRSSRTAPPRRSARRVGAAAPPPAQ